MTGPDKEDNIRRPIYSDQRQHESIEGVNPSTWPLVTSRYAAGTFADLRAEEITHQVINDILADPHSFGSENIRTALQLISRDLRDPGGSLKMDEVDFEEQDPVTGVFIGYRFCASKSTFDLKVVSFASLEEEYIRPGNSQIIDQQLLNALTEQGRTSPTFVIPENSSITFSVDVLEENSVRFGIWSNQYRCFVFTYEDEVIRAEYARGAVADFKPEQIVYQAEHQPISFESFELPHPAADIFLREDGYGERTYRCHQNSDATITLERLNELPGGVRIAPVKRPGDS